MGGAGGADAPPETMAARRGGALISLSDMSTAMGSVVASMPPKAMLKFQGKRLPGANMYAGYSAVSAAPATSAGPMSHASDAHSRKKGVSRSLSISVWISDGRNTVCTMAASMSTLNAFPPAAPATVKMTITSSGCGTARSSFRGRKPSSSAPANVEMITNMASCENCGVGTAEAVLLGL